MERKGRPVLGAVMGLFFGLFVGLDLFMFGIVALDSVVITVLLVAGLLAGIALGLTAPFGARQDRTATNVSAPGAASD